MTEPLADKKCVPCEGGVPTLTEDQIAEHLGELDDWSVTEDQRWIERSFKMKNFQQALDRLNRIGELAEDQQHHPDLHLTGYRQLKVRLTTHAIGGLSENDVVMAAKIDRLVDSP